MNQLAISSGTKVRTIVSLVPAEQGNKEGSD